MKRTRLLFCGLACLTLVLAGGNTSFAQEDAGDELIQMVIGLLSDSDKDVRALGLDQVRSEAKGEAATRQFAAQLPNLPLDGQLGLLRALSDRADIAARPAVRELLANSRNQQVKVAAIEALGFLGEPADLQLLMRSLTDGSEAERSAARTSLVRLRGESVPRAIAAEMIRAGAPLRVALIEILARRRAFEAISDLQSAAVDDDPTVRRAAMTALGQLAGPEDIPGMVQGVLKAERGREREAAEKCVMFVCDRIEDSQKRAQPVLAAMEKLPKADRMVILSTLGRVGGPAALKIVEAAIADPDSRMHEMGLRALCNWPDASTAERLIELTSTDRHPAHRTMALRALIRIAPLPDGRSDAQKLELLQKAMTLCTQDTERKLVLSRAAAIRTPETLRFVVPYLDQPSYAQQACQTIVELAHHRGLREPNKAEFDRALDKVIQTSKDATVVDRANRYKKGQTWVRPKSP